MSRCHPRYRRSTSRADLRTRGTRMERLRSADMYHRAGRPRRRHWSRPQLRHLGRRLRTDRREPVRPTNGGPRSPRDGALNVKNARPDQSGPISAIRTMIGGAVLERPVCWAIVEVGGSVTRDRPAIRQAQRDVRLHGGETQARISDRVPRRVRRGDRSWETGDGRPPGRLVGLGGFRRVFVGGSPVAVVGGQCDRGRAGFGLFGRAIPWVVSDDLRL